MAGTFEFVNVARPGDVKRHSTQIRRHVMKDIGKARRKPRPKKHREIILGEPDVADAEKDDEERGDASRVLSRQSPLRDGSLHTVEFPINMDEERMGLVRFMVDEARAYYRPFRFPWLSMGLSDAAAWHITLANAALFRSDPCKKKKGEFTSSVEAMKWYTMSLASVTKRLADPVASDSEGLVIAVTGFVCHDSSIGNFDRFRVHMEGLKRIVEKRGGLEALSNPFLRLMISWLDISGATYLNAKPRFGVPEGSIREVDVGTDSPYLERLLASWDANCSSLGDIMSAMKATAAVANYINRRANDSDFWTDDVTAARLLGPAFHEILCLEGRALPADPEDPLYSGTAAREAFRRAALVFLAAVKIRMGAGAYEMERHLDAFRQISQLPLVSWNTVPELNLWAHIVSAMQEESPSRAWHVLTIVGIMESMGLQTGRQALDIARGIIWVDAIDDGKSELLCREIDNYLEASVSPHLDDVSVDSRLDLLSADVDPSANSGGNGDHPVY
ncbi:hypothetical protein F4818DRAFT_149031 [Hypoxylon cercidicola]|nr:hypothetical protein F4818DRAFT_149031 [Hypoxylon cercidicola]